MTHRAQVSLSLRGKPAHRALPTCPSPTHLGRSRQPSQPPNAHPDGTVRGKTHRGFTTGAEGKGRSAPALGNSPRPRIPRGADSARFFPLGTPRGTPDPPRGRTGAVRPPQRIADGSDRRAVPGHRPRHSAPRHGTPLPGSPAPRSPALASCQPAPARPDQTRGLPIGTQRSGASHRPADGRTDRRAVPAAALPAGCPAEPLPGGVCRRRACWRCGAAEPRQERGARR